MRRILLVLTIMAVMAAMLVASAMPAFAQAERFEQDISLPEGDLAAESVTTPSDRINGHTHYRPAEPQGGGGGGATVQSPVPGESVEIAPGITAVVSPDATGKVVQTPSGVINTNAHVAPI